MIQFLLVFMVTFYSSSLYAAKWVTNKDHSEIKFQVPYMGVSEISGRFNKFTGEVYFRGETAVVDRLEVKIHSASVDTGNKLRDGHLRGTDFFQSEQHPLVIFKSKNVSQVKRNQYKAIGEMIIRGISRSVAIEFSITDSLKDTWGFTNKFVKFESKINRQEFKLKWNKTLADQKYLVGDDVTFEGTFQLGPSNQLTPTSKHLIPDTQYIRHRERIARGEIENDIQIASEGSGPKPKIFKKQESILPSAMNKDFRDSYLWWTALGLIGLLGFFGILFISYYVKNKIAESFAQKYEENGVIGFFSDSIVILLVSLYGISLWFVGWGIR